MQSGKQANFNFNFSIPTDYLIAIARKQLSSPDQDCRDVAKALLDATEVSTRTQNDLKEKLNTDGTIDLAPYFDHWIGDALDAAHRLSKSKDEDIRNMAECLINQSNAIAESKESFLKETKRILSKPSDNTSE